MQPGLMLSGHNPEPHVTQFGSKPLYKQLLTWMESLPSGTYPAIDAFNDQGGEYKPTDELAAQLNDAAHAHEPSDDGTKEAVILLLDLLGTGYPDETVTLGREV